MAKQEKFTIHNISWWQWLVIIWFFIGMFVLHFSVVSGNSVLWWNGVFMIIEVVFIGLIYVMSKAEVV